MKKIGLLLYLCLGVFCLSFAQEVENSLEQMNRKLNESMGLKIQFVWQNDLEEHEQVGKLLVNKEKFYLQLEALTTWFDGENQWTLLEGSDEVNLIKPTQEELQSINPYLLLAIYKEGYTYRLGGKQSYNGKQITEINLHAKELRKEIQHVRIYMDKVSFLPLYLEFSTKQSGRTKVSIQTLELNRQMKASTFSFDEKKYPEIEVIDLR